MLRPTRSLALALSALVLACTGDDPTTPTDPVEELLGEIQSATEVFQDVGAAVQAGYGPVSPCVVGPSGAMGIHYLNPALLDGEVVPTAPELLLYEPTGSGMRLVGVEYMVPAPDWDPRHDAPPQILGNAFADHRAEEDRHGIPFPHYDLHVWAWEANPDGAFLPYNVNVSCAGAG
jgi:hypothetical protein